MNRTTTTGDPTAGVSRRSALRAGLGLPLVTAALLADPAGAGGTPERPTVNVADHAPTGVIDRAAIRRAIAAIPPSGGVLHIPAGHHQVTVAAGAAGSPTAPHRVADLPSHVEVQGYGATLELIGSMPSGSCVFRAEQAVDLAVRGLSVVGPGGGPAGATGLALFACTDVHLEDVTIARLPAMGIRVGADAAGAPSRSITIEASSVVDCAAGCIVLVGAEEVAISACTLGAREASGPRPVYGVGVASSTFPNGPVTVGSSHISGCAVGVDCIGNGTTGLNLLASTFGGNTIGARLRADGMVVVANSIHRCGAAALSAIGTGIRIEANSVNHSGGGVAVSGSDVLVRANVIYNCGAGLTVPAGSVVEHNMVRGQVV